MSHYFIAIHLPEELQQLLSKWQQIVKEHLSYKQWPHMEDLHVTLKFLGEVDDNRLKQLRHELQEVNNIPAFDLEVGGIGMFGNPKKPRVIWSGVKGDPVLSSLQQTVEECCLRINYERENREYRPHITLAKKWNGASSLNDDTWSRLQEQLNKRAMLHVKEMVLFRIHPSKTPKYEVVERYPLKPES